MLGGWVLVYRLLYGICDVGHRDFLVTQGFGSQIRSTYSKMVAKLTKCSVCTYLRPHCVEEFKSKGLKNRVKQRCMLDRAGHHDELQELDSKY